MFIYSLDDGHWVVSTVRLIQIIPLWTFACKVLCGLELSNILARDLGLWLLVILWQLYVYNLKELPDCFPKQLHNFTLSPASYLSSSSSTASLVVVTIHLFYCSHLSRCKVVFHEDLTCISLITNGGEQLSMFLFVICMFL